MVWRAPKRRQLHFLEDAALGLCLCIGSVVLFGSKYIYFSDSIE